MRALKARLARPATLAALVATALWVAAAIALWDSASTVPASLHLPHVEASRFFGRSFLERSASFDRFLYVDGLLAIATLLVVLGLYARRGHRLMRESAAGRVGTGMLLGMLGFAIVWLTEIPFGLAAVWWERRHGISHQGYVEWLIESFLSLGSTFLFVSLALAVAMGLAGVLRRWWWAAAVPIFAGLALLSTFVGPYLIPGTEPLRDRQLVADARALERSEGVGDTRLRVQDVHRFTTAPNAEAGGFGASRTVVLWDTLLDDRFSDAEVRMVLAHEIGHLAHDDALRRVGWLALFLVPATALIAYLTRGRGGMARPEAVPIALFVLVALQLLFTPFFNAVSRAAALKSATAIFWVNIACANESPIMPTPPRPISSRLRCRGRSTRRFSAP